MLATQNDPIKTCLNTTTTSKGQTRQHITSINLTTHTRSILGRTYWKLMTNPDITQLNTTTPPLRYNQTKRLTGRSGNTFAWAMTLLAHTDELTSYEKGLRETEEEPHQLNPDHQPPINTPHTPTPPTKGKEKCPQLLGIFRTR
jgi:hypothetical protein